MNTLVLLIVAGFAVLQASDAKSTTNIVELQASDFDVKGNTLTADAFSKHGHVFVEFTGDMDDPAVYPKACTGDERGKSCGGDMRGTVWDHVDHKGTKQGLTFARFRCKSSVCHADGFAIYQTPTYAMFYKGGPMMKYFGDYSDFNYEGLMQLISQESRAEAWELLQQHRKTAILNAEANVQNEDGQVQVMTSSNFESLLKPVRAVEGQQVLVLFHGQVKQCREQQQLLDDAMLLLKGEERITLSKVNCDVHRTPCENAGVAGYCHFNLYNRESMCPMVIAGPRGSAYYEGEWTANGIKEYILKKRGAGRQYRSEAPPESNNDPMTVVVGKTFQDLVLGTPVHIMVEFYAPWCGACTQFAESWEKIAEQTKQHYGGAIRVAKMDATENEVKGFDMPQSFPTILWFRKHEWACATCKLPNPDPKRGEKYSGELNVKEVTKWITEQWALEEEDPGEDEL